MCQLSFNASATLDDLAAQLLTHFFLTISTSLVSFMIRASHSIRFHFDFGAGETFQSHLRYASTYHTIFFQLTTGTGIVLFCCFLTYYLGYGLSCWRYLAGLLLRCYTLLSWLTRSMHHTVFNGSLVISLSTLLNSFTL